MIGRQAGLTPPREETSGFAAEGNARLLDDDESVGPGREPAQAIDGEFQKEDVSNASFEAESHVDGRQTGRRRKP